DFQVEQKLVDAISRLPEDVRELALERCFFVAIGGDEGGSFFAPETITGLLDVGSGAPRYLVVLNSGWKLNDFQSAVAHEIAHIWLRDPDADFGDEAERHENEAAALAREWGFTGIGSLPFRERP